MMKRYLYKIQWLIDVVDTKKGLKNFKSLIEVLGSKSLDVINFRDNDYKIVWDYDSMSRWNYIDSDIITIKAVRKIVKNNLQIRYIEVVRK